MTDNAIPADKPGPKKIASNEFDPVAPGDGGDGLFSRGRVLPAHGPLASLRGNFG